MFQFLKKNESRNSYNQSSFPNPNQQQFPGQFNTSYDLNMLYTQVNELNRQINDLYHRISRIENYLGIRDESMTNPNF